MNNSTRSNLKNQHDIPIHFQSLIHHLLDFSIIPLQLPFTSCCICIQHSFIICKQGYTYDFVIDFIHWYYCDSQGSFLDSSFPSPSDYTFWHKDFLVQQWYVQWDYQIELLLYIGGVKRHEIMILTLFPPHTLFKINT